MPNEPQIPGIQPQQPAAPAQQPVASQQPAVPAQQVVMPQQPAAPAQQAVASQQSAAPAQQVVAPQPSIIQKPPMPVRPGQPVKQIGNVRRPPNPKKLMVGCGGCSSLALLMFIIFVLVFVSQTSATGENPLARALGMNSATFVNNMITLVHLIFASFSTVLFLIALVGLFRLGMARKDDKETKKKGLAMAGVSGLLLFVMIFIWIGMTLYLNTKRVPVEAGPTEAIYTEPADTLGLTAPVTIKFDASYAPVNTKKYDILSYNWNFGDGETSSTMVTTHTYNDKGETGRFDAELKISKLDKQTGEEVVDSYTKIITIANVELSADFTAEPMNGPAPLSVDFDASASKAPAGEITSFEWDFDNNNGFTDASGVAVSHTFEQVGIYKVKLRVTDNTGQYKISTKEINVEGANVPTAVIDIPSSSGKYFVGQSYTFQADKSTSPNGKITKFEWDFGDNSPKANTKTANHIYKAAGEYDVALKVTDESGKSSDIVQRIKLEIAESAPLAAFATVPAPGKEMEYIEGPVPFEVAFDGSKSQDSDNNIVDYKWDFDGDGTVDSAGEQVTYAYKTPGVFNATLIVTDAEDNESKAVFVVKALAQPLQARLVAEPIEGVYPLTVTFDASSSSYPSGQIVSYEWDFGDGTPKRVDVSKITYKYTKVGTFTVKVTAIASDNSKSTAEISVNVRPVALTACFTANPESGEAPLTVQFDPYCSQGTIAKYNWDFGDGKTMKTRKPSYTYEKPGSYTVTLQLTDNQNVLST